MNVSNMIFFSNRCDASQILLSLLKNERILRFFEIVCTDNNPNIPPEIKVTPTLLIKRTPQQTDPNQSKWTIYQAGQAFIWLEKIKQWRGELLRRHIASVSDSNRSQSAESKAQEEDLAKIIGFSKEEMSGISDMFALMDVDEALPHSQMEYNKMGGKDDHIYYVGLKKDSEVKLDEESQIKLTKKILEERKKDDVSRIKEIDIVKNKYSVRKP